MDWGKLKLIPDSQEDGIIDSFDEQENLSQVLEVKPTVIQDEEVPKVDHPVFSSSHLSTFEGVFLSEEQVIKYKDMFLRGVKSSNPFFLAWKAFKAASLPTEKETLDSVPGSHTPKTFLRGKPMGVGRFQREPVNLIPHQRNGGISWTLPKKLSHQLRKQNC